MEINSKVGDNIWTSLYGSSSLKSRKHFFKHPCSHKASPFRRLSAHLSCLTRGRRCPGCARKRINPRCRPFGKKEVICTTTSSPVSLPKKSRRECEGGYWQMTWDW